MPKGEAPLGGDVQDAEALAARCLDALAGGERHLKVLGLGARGYLLSRMDRRGRTILEDLRLLYPVDVGGLMALRRRGWRGRWPMGKRGPLEEVLAQGPARLGRPLRLFHFGGRPGEGRGVMDALCPRFPGVEDAGIRSVLDELWGPENNQALFAIGRAKPDILYVSLPSPLLEEWIHAHAAIVDAGILWGVPR